MSIWFTIIPTDLADSLKKQSAMLYTSYKAVVIVNKIKELRLLKGWTQAELGRVLNCSDVAVGRYESEKRDLDTATIHALCDVFGCSADYLLGRSDLPSADLDPEEVALLLAWRAATPEIRGIVDHALEPYKKDAAGSSATA